ncbi:MAG TPA: hypothetical protein VFU22_33735, partial [Roseiflexaceae bacterium]|nr:hypothetical protein [Roseiflexaceae bacterium]
DPANLTPSLLSAQSIAVSEQDGSGLFELSFRDERYLPFEGAGVVKSSWRLELSGKWQGADDKIHDLAQFDFDTISDVIMHLRYTARDGREPLKNAARSALQNALKDAVQFPQHRLFSLRHEFPNQWYHFLHPANTSGNQTLSLPLDKDRFPFLFQSKTITINSIELFVKVNETFTGPNPETNIKLTLAAGNTAPTSATAQPQDILTLDLWNEILHAIKTLDNPAGTPGTWTLNAWLKDGDRLDPRALEDIVVICHYAVNG